MNAARARMSQKNRLQAYFPDLLRNNYALKLSNYGWI